MLSVATQDGRMSMRGHTMKAPPAAPPAASKPSAAHGGNGGRKLREQSRADAMMSNVSSDEDLASKATTKTKKGPKTMEELDKRIEEDELALINMKREIREQQKSEISKVQNSLIQVKKQYDGIHSSNRALSKKLADVMDRMKTLKGVDDAMHESSQDTQARCRELTRQLASIEELVAAEQRTMDMQTMMQKRLEGDTNAVKIENGTLSFALDKVKVELNAAMATLQISKVELAERDRKLDEMIQQAKFRRKERSRRMDMLHRIVNEGENNLEMVEAAVDEEAKLHSPREDLITPEIMPPSVTSSPGRGADYDAGAGGGRELPIATEGTLPPFRGATAVAAGGRNKGNKGNLTINTAFLDNPEDFSEPVDSPRLVAKRLNLEQIEDMVARYRTRDYRMEKLSHLESDLKENISRQNVRANELGDALLIARQKIEQLASTRQIYQEVDHKNKALAEARKVFDEYNDKEYNMRVNLTALKRAIPRLLAKMTKVQHPVPGDAQLSDSLQKLGAELLKYFKDIQQAMAKEYNAEELAIMQSMQGGEGSAGGGQDANGASEIDKLKLMPGYEKIQQELYSNMMGARPDMSANNVRIPSEMQKKRVQETFEAIAGDSPLPERLYPSGARMAGGGGGAGGAKGSSPGKENLNVVFTVRKSLDEGIDITASSSKEEKETEAHITADGGLAITKGVRQTAAMKTGAGAHGGHNGHGKHHHDPGTHAALIPDPVVIDRNTAKAISALVLERDGGGVIPEKPKPKPKKKPYKQRHINI